MTDTICPICDNDQLYPLISRSQSGAANYYSCTLCGDYILDHIVSSTLPNIIKNGKDVRVKISHAIRQMQKKDKHPTISYHTIENILEKPLPRHREQADLLIRWLAENIRGIGEEIVVAPNTHKAIIGAKSDAGFWLILNHLLKIELITGNQQMMAPSWAKITLSFKGWDYYEDLQHGKAVYRKAFMAMQFGETELDNIVSDIFKPSVEQTGFELIKLDDNPKAGLIDDRLRVEIQSSDFIIADLTHDNLGAYWEAGYAEGMGKPVIYTCKKQKFDEEKTHFDTNHHLTIRWDKNDPEKAGEELKATIRATLPDLARLKD
ncbi:MAG: hypothetical protein QM487_15215 [Candidatus Marithrix sp.]